MATLVPLQGPFDNQFETPVDKYQPFNGATCLVIVNVHVLGYSFATAEVQAGRAGPDDARLGMLVEAEIRRQINACPAGSAAKVQLIYHADEQILAVDRRTTRKWKIQNSIRDALRRFQQNPEPRFKKLFLCGCFSHADDRDLVDEAFRIPSISHVVTFTGLIFLGDGRVSGATIVFGNRELHIYVWTKDAQGRQIAQAPAKPIGKEEELDLGTLLIEKKGSAAVDRCPTQHMRTGSGTEFVDSFPSRAAAQAAIIALSSFQPPFPYSFALLDADADKNSFSCPNRSCQTKSVSAVAVTDYSWVIRRLFFGRFRLSVSYDWSSRITCR